MKVIYNLGILLYVLAVRLLSPVNSKAKLWTSGRKRWDDRLQKNIKKEDINIWIHCASLGEFEQGRPLIEGIKKIRPDYKIILTFFSPSGYEIRKNYSLADYVCYLPADTPLNAAKFISILNPAAAIFIKYEFWDNYSAILENRIMYNFKDGINLDCCDYATVSDNLIMYNELNGLFIFESSNASINHNLLIENKEYGLYLKHDDFKVGSHTVVDNRFYECGVFSERSFKNFFQNNTINDLPLLYLEDITDYTVSDQSYGSIMLISCDRITVQHQKIHNTSIAV